ASMKLIVKTVALIGLGLFLYSRIWSCKLYFYINERFYWLIVFAALGFILIGCSYYYKSMVDQEYDDHDHHDHGDHQHSPVSWVGLALVALPIVLGLAVQPRPLGAAAMVNRDVTIESLTSAAAPEEGFVLNRPAGEKNILDWLVEFRAAPDLSTFEGQEAELIGFVYRDDRFGADQFMVSRFVLSCCAADAAPLGLIVEWPDAPELADDQWVEVKGHLTPSNFAGEDLPILVAESVTLTDIPDRPYLYPF
ncbi:MAG: TIGR03943 family protein, partial [Chloroflexota bacterium]